MQTFVHRELLDRYTFLNLASVVYHGYMCGFPFLVRYQNKISPFVVVTRTHGKETQMKFLEVKASCPAQKKIQKNKTKQKTKNLRVLPTAKIIESCKIENNINIFQLYLQPTHFFLYLSLLCRNDQPPSHATALLPFIY